MKKLFLCSALLCTPQVAFSVDTTQLSQMCAELRQTEKKVEELLDAIASQRSKIAEARRTLSQKAKGSQ